MRKLMRSIVAVLAAVTLSAGVFATPAAATGGVQFGVVSYELAFYHAGKCLDVLNLSQDLGAPVGLWECNGGSNQTWIPERISSDDREFRLRAQHSDMCLDLVGNSTANGATFGQWECNTGRNQAFRYWDSGVGGWFFQVQHSGKCLDVIGFATANGSPVGQWDCDPTGTAANQRILFTRR